MTRIAIISDLHSNIDAVNLFLKDAEKKNVDRIICLGDLVTKFFYPKEVVDAVRSEASLTVKGNCDAAVVNNQNFRFARGKLGLDRLEYLANLPQREQLLISGILINFFHATPDSLDKMYNPLFSNENTHYKHNVLENYQKMLIPNTNEQQNISICGHTHNEYLVYGEDDLVVAAYLNGIKEQMVLPKDKDIIINVGSVGSSTKMISHANGSYSEKLNDYISYVILEGELSSAKISDIKVEFVRVPYRKTLRKVYLDMLRGQSEKEFPHSPEDTQKIYDGLKQMGARKLPTLEEEMKKNDAGKSL